MQVSDRHITKNVPLPSPAEMISEISRSPEQAEFMDESREIIRNILKGTDSRFLLIVGPCSIHDPKAGLEYAEKLAALAEQVKDKVYIVMRVYFEKPLRKRAHFSVKSSISVSQQRLNSSTRLHHNTSQTLSLGQRSVLALLRVRLTARWHQASPCLSGLRTLPQVTLSQP